MWGDLPPGVTDAMIDRHFGGSDEDEDEDRDPLDDGDEAYDREKDDRACAEAS